MLCSFDEVLKHLAKKYRMQTYALGLAQSSNQEVLGLFYTGYI